MISLRKLLPLLALIFGLGCLYLPGCDTLVTEVNEYTIAGHPEADFELDTDSANCIDSGFFCQGDSGCAPHTVRFLDISKGPRDTWIWDFGDGTGDTANITADSTDTIGINPIYVYREAGTYTVSLTVIDSSVDGEPGRDQEVKKRFITVGTSIDSFSVNTVEGCPGLEVTFSPFKYSGITSYSWDFGDGSSLVTDSNPTHTYDSVGVFSCTLTIDAACGSDIIIGYDSLITINACPLAMIDAQIREGCAPLSVQFADISDYRGVEGDSIHWWFETDSMNTTAFPLWEFETAGLYTVHCTVWSAGGTDDTTEVDFIRVWGPPEATIEALGPTEGCLDNNWHFTVPFEAVMPASADTAAYDSLIWIFGDGNRSNPNDPLPFRVTHAYTGAGLYTVRLYSYGQCYFDGDSATIDVVDDFVRTAYPYDSELAGFIVGPDADTAAAGIQGDTTVTFTFTDTTPGDLLGWNWTFGDGQSELGQEVTHQYTDTGTFTATLVVGNSCQSDTIEQTIVIDTIGAFGAFRRYRDQTDKR